MPRMMREESLDACIRQTKSTQTGQGKGRAQFSAVAMREHLQAAHQRKLEAFDQTIAKAQREREQYLNSRDRAEAEAGPAPRDDRESGRPEERQPSLSQEESDHNMAEALDRELNGEQTWRDHVVQHPRSRRSPTPASAEPAGAAGNLNLQNKRKRASPEREPEEQLDWGCDDDAEPAAAAAPQPRLRSEIVDPAAAAAATTTAASSSRSQTSSEGTPSADAAQLRAARKRSKKMEKLAKLVKHVVHVCHDDFVAQQGNQTSQWLDSIADRAELFGFPVDKLPLLLGQDLVGPKTMNTLLQAAPDTTKMTWSTYRDIFLRCFPGTPPLVTRNTWKQLSMNKQGSYHAFVTEFSRQLALIEAGPAEIIEQFLHGLSAQLRTQIEFCKHRAWRGDEFQELVNMCTELVNSVAASSKPDASTEPRSNQRTGRSHNKGSQPAANRKRSFSAGPQQGSSSRAGQPTKHVGRTPTGSKAIAQFCFEHRLCKFCKEPVVTIILVAMHFEGQLSMACRIWQPGRLLAAMLNLSCCTLCCHCDVKSRG